MSDDIDIGQISEALNDKMDRDVGNPATLGESRMSGFGMPSDNYEDLTLGTSGAEYTAPANGYFCINFQTTQSGGFVQLSLNPGVGDTDIYGSVSDGDSWSGQSSYIKAFLPVKKGDIVKAFYSNITSNGVFRFVYAKGEENV